MSSDGHFAGLWKVGRWVTMALVQQSIGSSLTAGQQEQRSLNWSSRIFKGSDYSIGSFFGYFLAPFHGPIRCRGNVMSTAYVDEMWSISEDEIR